MFPLYKFLQEEGGLTKETTVRIHWKWSRDVLNALRVFLFIKTGNFNHQLHIHLLTKIKISHVLPSTDETLNAECTQMLSL